MRNDGWRVRSGPPFNSSFILPRSSFLSRRLQRLQLFSAFALGHSSKLEEFHKRLDRRERVEVCFEEFLHDARAAPPRRRVELLDCLVARIRVGLSAALVLAQEFFGTCDHGTRKARELRRVN